MSTKQYAVASILREAHLPDGDCPETAARTQITRVGIRTGEQARIAMEI